MKELVTETTDGPSTHKSLLAPPPGRVDTSQTFFMMKEGEPISSGVFPVSRTERRASRYSHRLGWGDGGGGVKAAASTVSQPL